ncbi:hypothetical protein ACIBAG_28450 [Streptomyces sp. NPDC051243]|uniref:hypothetical protein n=1 Tax=Streptomyces sp. NPDC051243 TaxID=3365646 RepID=UPI0037BC90CF
MANQQITELIAYLQGDRDILRLAVDVQPLAENVGRLAQTCLGDAVASIQQRSEPDFQAFTGCLAKTAAQLVGDERPDGLPTLAHSPDQAERAAQGFRMGDKRRCRRTAAASESCGISTRQQCERRRPSATRDSTASQVSIGPDTTEAANASVSPGAWKRAPQPSLTGCQQSQH